jgi:hypothetical protein
MFKLKSLFISVSAALWLAIPAHVSADMEKVRLYGTRDQRDYLGCYNCKNMEPDSICNVHGSFGSPFSASSIWNKLGIYGTRDSLLSPWNEFGTGLFVINDRGRFLGKFHSNVKSKNTSFDPEFTEFASREIEEHGDTSILRDKLCVVQPAEP